MNEYIYYNKITILTELRLAEKHNNIFFQILEVSNAKNYMQYTKFSYEFYFSGGGI